MKRRLMVIVGLLLIVTLLVPVACSPQQSKVVPIKTLPAPTPTPTPMPAPMPPTRGDIAISGGGEAGTVGLALSSERMIVRNGDISLVVKDVVGTRDKIAQIAVRMDGYVVSSSIWGEEEETRGNISIRVPDEKFDEALVELRGLAVRVESESTNSQDVTEQYVDLEARLKVAQATESQYLALLDKAKDVEETLKIYDALSRVRSEIEQIKGRMQYLERITSMSLITVQLKAVATAKPLVSARWSGWETLKSAVRGIVAFGQVLVNIAIWLLIFLPIWGTILGIVLWRLNRRRRKQVKTD